MTTLASSGQPVQLPLGGSRQSFQTRGTWCHQHLPLHHPATLLREDPPAGCSTSEALDQGSWLVELGVLVLSVHTLRPCFLNRPRRFLGK